MKYLSNIFVVLTLSACFTVLTAQTKDKLPLRLYIGTYNVGHFNQGKVGGYQGDEVKEELMRWKNWIGAQKFDIFVVNEWNNCFDKDSVYDAKKELLKPFFENLYFGKTFKYINNGICTNFELTNIRTVTWSRHDYYAILGDWKVGGITVTIMSTHVPWQEEHHEPSFAMQLEEMKKYKYLICCGDMNASDKNQLRFTEAGFNAAQGDREGWHCTAAGGRERGRTHNLNIDNIVTTKNIRIMNISAPETGLNDHDHFPLTADLIITR
jgi:endonuclease/exonuclease/phosphatase family metal-dependent hydrolase